MSASKLTVLDREITATMLAICFDLQGLFRSTFIENLAGTTEGNAAAVWACITGSIQLDFAVWNADCRGASATSGSTDILDSDILAELWLLVN